MIQPAPIPQYLLILSIIVLLIGVPLCTCPITLIGCQPSVFPLNPDRRPIFPLRKKKHAAPSEAPASQDVNGPPTGAAPTNPARTAALSLPSGRSGVAGDNGVWCEMNPYESPTHCEGER